MEQSQQKYDAIVIGTGQGGVPLAFELAGRGQKVAVLEERHVGGSCVNYGCTPTKTMLASARVAHLAKRGGDFGVQIPSVDIDLRRIRDRKRAVVKQWQRGGEKGLKDADNIDLIFAHGEFTAPHELSCEKQDGTRLELTADMIFINTGARMRIPSVEGLNELDTLSAETIMELAQVPEHLLIIGGGYIGVEFGQMFRRFGADVTIVQKQDQLLPREDDDVAKELFSIFQDEGIGILLNTTPRHVRKSGQGIEMIVETPGGEQSLDGSHLLLAAGRVPNTASLGLEKSGIETDSRGFIRVNDHLETSVDGIYALGDVKMGPAFTHISYDDFRVIRDHLYGSGIRTMQDRPVPYTVFTDPQLGRVGLSEKQAQKEGRSVKVVKFPMSSVARAIETDETRGSIKVLLEPETHKILGVAVLGVEGGEMMSLIQVAMMNDMTGDQLRDTVFAHPLFAESLNNVFAQLGAK